uniref:uncharacterized protein n=1 Tax=Pristiophorus japonicus TaxID=55135 RepID=UPI00398F5002
MPVLLKTKISNNHSEQRCTGGGTAQLQPLSDLEERAAALVGHESRSATTRGLAEPSYASRQPEMLVEVAHAPAPTGGEEEQEEDEQYTTTEPEEAEEEEQFMEGDEPAATLDFSIETRGNRTKRRAAGSAKGHYSAHTDPTEVGSARSALVSHDNRLEGLISWCAEMVAISRELLQGFTQFTRDFSQVSAVQAELLEVARQTLEQMREQTAATNALRHALLAEHGAALLGVMLRRSISLNTQTSTEEPLPPGSEDDPTVSLSTPTPPPRQAVFPLPAACQLRLDLRGPKRAGEPKKKLSNNRAERRHMGGGLPKCVELSDLEERAAALVGTHTRLPVVVLTRWQWRVIPA